jgi:hypothetical protein
MKGDFSRWTYDPTKQYSRLLSLQGRVFLDADFNEAMELQLQHLRKLTADLLGPHAGKDGSFEIAPTSPASNDFFITTGSYYVNGILCENPPVPPPDRPAKDPGPRYTTQPYLSSPRALETGPGVVYLDVWERFVTYIEDEDRTPAELQQTIREVALGGPDTAGRSQVVWQVRFLPFPDAANLTNNNDNNLQKFTEQMNSLGVIRTIEDGRPHPIGKLKARSRKPKADDQPCATNPESRYRGPENQLYRVEIHGQGTFPQGAAGPAPSFKWSRENGSVVFAIRTIEGPTVLVETLGRDERFGLKPGDLVEVVDDEYVLQNRAEPLLRVKSIDPETFTIVLDASPVSNVGQDPKKHPILRRWEGAAPISVNADPESEGYLALEDGVEVCFSASGDYMTSDYWIIPARTATGDVEWPGPLDNPREIPPHGIIHAYAPLAVVTVPAGGGALTPGKDLRRMINQLWT